jgi:hypothetical protein
MTKAAAPPEQSPFAEADEVPERALRIYSRLWQFETWLRRMVYIELRALLGDDWSRGLNASSSFEADKQLRHMPTPEMNALSYSQLSKLTKIIGENWKCFETYFPPRAIWDARLQEISQIRHRIAHFRIGHADDYSRIIQFLRDIDKGFWTFCTSYNNPQPVLPQSDDPVIANFLPLDPLPWVEVEPKKWALIGSVNREPVVGMVVNVLTRPWADRPGPVSSVPGYFYDVTLRAHSGRKFAYSDFLESSKKLHGHVAHICLDSMREDVRLTVPSILGQTKVIELLGAFLEFAKHNVRRSPIPEDADAVAAEWPEYVLGPRDPLSFLAPDMKCGFFGV